MLGFLAPSAEDVLPLFLRCAVLLLVAGTLFAQGTAKKKAEPAPPDVAPDDMVIVIPGECQTEPLEFATRDCIRGLTRQEFEAVVAATNPSATPEYRRQLAERLARIIILSNEARKRGLPKDPEVHELLRMVQAQELANALLHRIEIDSGNISDADIAAYFQAHSNDYKLAEFIRIAIARKQTADDQSYAEGLRTRCAAGEDPAKIAADAAEHAGAKVSPPEDLKDQRSGQYPAAQRSIFDLKPGECGLIAANEGEFHIYKMVASRAGELSEVRDAVVRAIQNGKMKTELNEITGQHEVNFNDKYFPAANAAPEKMAPPTMVVTPK
jgi:hypothetical protein